jgi:leucyl-tRNA synthetase
MEFVNLVQPYVRGGGDADVAGDAIDTLLLLLAPMAPHLTAEAWEHRHGDHVHEHAWPVADPAFLVEETVTMVVQVNGKVRPRSRHRPCDRDPRRGGAAAGGRPGPEAGQRRRLTRRRLRT